MSFKCSKCPQMLSSKERLETHLNKNLPCDFQCRQCDFKGLNRIEYYAHFKKVHKSVPEEKVQISHKRPRAQVRLPPLPGATPETETIPLIPIQDFDPQCLKELAALSNEQNVEIVLERIRLTIRPLIHKRAEEAVKSFQTADYASSLHCLDQDVNKVAAEILNRFHGDPDRPQLHIIKMADWSRKTVNIYSRPTENASKWLSFAKEPALTTLSEHVSAVLMYALWLAANMLQYKFCVREKTVCFYLHDPVLDKTLIIVDCNDFENDDGLLASLGYPPTLKVMFYDGEIADIEQGYGYTEKARKLGELIQQKTEEVFVQLKNLVLKEADVISFLERTRRPMTRQLIKK